MANLGNSKIKDTYQLVLQSDASGNLQKLDGATPSLIFNSSFKYKVGSLVDGYVLKSDGSGNVSWGAVAFSGDVYISGGSINSTTIELQTTSGATVSIPGLSWSSNTSGHISNSGLTGNIGIGTSIPNKKLTVVGDISGTTDLYLGNSTHTASTITAQGELNIKGNGLNDYLRVSNDFFGVWMDGAQEIVVSPTETTFNASSRAVDFAVLSDDGTQLIRTRAEKNIVRLHDHVSINQPTGWNWENEQQQALAVSGTSVFYSGGTSNNSEAIVAIGNISGTTDLYLGDPIHTASTITAQEELKIKGREADNDFLWITKDRFQFYLDGAEAVTYISETDPSSFAGFAFNTARQDLDFKVSGEDGSILQIYGEEDENRIRITDHLAIGDNNAVSHSESVKWGLAVTGSSLFYSGGSSHNTEAIVAVGNISGTTDLHIDGTIKGNLTGEVTGNASTATKIVSITNSNIVQLTPTQTLTNKTLTTPVIASISNSGTVTIPTGADTLVARTSTDTLTNKTLTTPTITMGTNKITGLGNPTAAQDAVTKAYVDGLDHVDYWSANTDGSISTSGVTNVKISGNTHMAGTLNVTGTITGNLTGEVTGNARTSTKIAAITNNDIVQLEPTQTLTNKTLTSPVFNTGISGTAFLDEDDMASNSANKVASQQSIVSFINRTRMDWMKTTGGIKLLSSNNWVGFNRTTGGLDSSGFWNADLGGTALSNVHSFYGSYWNTVFTAPYGGYLKRLLIQGANTTNSEVGEDWNIYLAKSPVVNDSDSISWSQVTGFTRTLPADRNKRFIYDIPLNGTTGVAISQYDTFILAFQGTAGATTWITANIILEFEYNIE